MAYEITLPRLGWDMEEGSLAGWLKQDGEFVQSGELLFSVEGDKAVQEIEALDSGYLHILPSGPQPGQKVAVGTLIGYLVPESERNTFRFPSEMPEEAPGVTHVTIPAPASPVHDGPERLSSQAIIPGQPTGRRIYISPYARRLADKLGVNWQALKGSGLRGRIMAKDVEQAVEQERFSSSPAGAPSASAVTPAQTGGRFSTEETRPAQISFEASRQPMSSVRRKIAEGMARSAHTTASVTLTTEVDASELVKLRKALKEDSDDPVPSYNDLLAKAVAHGLMEHPLLNARLEDEEIVQPASVHIAIAVDTERGLIVPVLRDVQTKTLRQVANESAALIDRCRKGTIAYEDLQGGTFTITNLGMYEIDAFTPIIDLPQCAVLGVGRIVPKQVVVDVETGQVAVQQRMFLSLTFDHRLVDGAQAARFLQRVMRLIERPYLWMAG